MSCIEEFSSMESEKTNIPDYWNCIVSIVTNKDTNEVTEEHIRCGEYGIGVDDEDEFLRIFLLNRDYTYKTETIHTQTKT